MGKLIHTIKLNGSEGRRESATRAYVACLVVTVTDESVARDTAAKAQTEANLAERSKLLAEALEAQKTTVEDAKAAHEAASAAWFNPTDGYTVTRSAIIEKLRAESGRYRGVDSAKSSAMATAELVSRGLVDPWDPAGVYGIVKLAGEVSCLQNRLADWAAPVVGSQFVLSWHMTVGAANKSLGSREAGYHRERGCRIDVRTDITVRERASRQGGG